MIIPSFFVSVHHHKETEVPRTDTDKVSLNRGNNTNATDHSYYALFGIISGIM